jgi:two-component system, OmpR family, sensor histidine kinase TctE
MKSPLVEHSPGTLRRRLLFLLLVPLTLMLVVSLVADYRIAFEPAGEAYDHALTDDAVALAGRVRFQDGMLQVDLPAAAEAVLRTDRSDKEYLSIRTADDRLLSGDADLQPEPRLLGVNPRLSDGQFRGQKIRKATYRIDTAGGEVVVTVAETTSKRERAGSKILAGMMLPNILMLFAALAIVYVGVRRGLAPLLHLSQQIGRRAPHDLGPLPRGEVPAEAEPLIVAMDGLIGDLRTAALAQQAFLANAAHQLKTPLAGLQTQLELHVEELPAAYRERGGRLLDATRRLGHLTHQLLALARSGPEADVSQEKRPVDLGGLLESSASAWFDLALARQIDLGFEVVPVQIDGSEWLLRELLGNLIDNALNYTPSGGKVTARCGYDEVGRPFVEVEDNGPGIPTAERERIFERFYRAEGSPGQGTGLGLAIVKEVAERHAAIISVHAARPAGGTCFRVSFPSALPDRDFLE